MPVWLVPHAGSYRELLAAAFCLGVAGTTFPVGIRYVSRWTPAARQGGALGVYGLGNVGQSAVVFLGPLAAAAIGWQSVFRLPRVVLERRGDELIAVGMELRPEA